MKKKYKKKKYFIIIVIVFIIALCIFLISVLKKGHTNTQKTSDNKVQIKNIENLLKKDQEIKTMIYGDIKLEEASANVNNSLYYLYNEKKFTSINSFIKIINKIYDSKEANKLLNDIHNYNEIIEVSGELYVKKNPKCNIPEFEDGVKIKSSTSKKIVYIYKNNEYIVNIEKGKYKFTDTPFTCGNIET